METRALTGQCWNYAPRLYISNRCWCFSHEKPVQNELSKQNIQDRYHGRNDPVAKKIMSTHAANMGLQPPEDQNIVRHTSCLSS